MSKIDYYRQYFRVKGLSVSYDGKKVKREYENKNIFNANPIHFLSIQTDKNGNLFVSTKDHGIIRVDELVARCFCPPDKNGNKNHIIHVDRDKKNCHKNNLKWVTADEYRNFYRTELTYTDNETGEEFIWSTQDFYVSRSGRVQMNRKECTIENLVDDPDLGCMRAITPRVREYWGGKSYCVDDLVANVFCDKLPDVKSKVILHVDYDMTNNNADNLKWVEPDNPEYAKYVEQMKKDITTTNLKYSTMP